MPLNYENLQNEKESMTESLIENKKEVSVSGNIPETTSATTNDVPDFGWSNYAERINGRFAMIGFVAILIIEILTHKGFLTWAGLMS